MTGRLDDADRARHAAGPGSCRWPPTEALALFDAALAAADAVLVPVRLDLAALRAGGDDRAGAAARPGPRGPPRGPSAAPGPAGAAAPSGWPALAAADRDAALLDLVRGQVAAVLGHAGAGRRSSPTGRSRSSASTR